MTMTALKIRDMEKRINDPTYRPRNMEPVGWIWTFRQWEDLGKELEKKVWGFGPLQTWVWDGETCQARAWQVQSVCLGCENAIKYSNYVD